MALPPARFPEAVVSNMTKLQRELEGSAEGLIDLTHGYPDGLQQPWMRALSQIPARRLQSANPRQLKQEIAGWFASRYAAPPGGVLVTNTATEALAVVIGTVVEEAGDEVILFDGCFDPYPALIRSFKAKPVFAPRLQDGTPRLSALSEMLTRRTRAVLLTHPDNPLGHVYSKQEFEFVRNFCENAGLILIVDAAFAFISPYGVDTFGPLAAIGDGARTIVIGDTGKVFDLFGVRCGVMIAGGKMTEVLQSRLDHLFFRMDSVRLHLLASALSHKSAPGLMEYVNQTVATNFNYLERKISKRVRVIHPLAGSLAILEFEGVPGADVELADGFRHLAGVAMVPYSYFWFANPRGGSMRSRLRIALARRPELIRRAVGCLNTAMEQVGRGLIR